MSYRYLSESEIKWLKNRRNDSRPEVQELARQVFEERFPRQARNEIKAQLHIKSMVFHVRGEMFDGYGDEYIVNAELTADTTGVIVKKIFDESEAFIEEKSVNIGVKAARKLFNVAVHNHDISFWDTDLCHEISCDPDIDLLPEFLDDDFDDFNGDELDADTEAEQADAVPDDRVLAWSVEIKYKDETEQNIKGYDFIPDPVMELFNDIDGYFEDEPFDSEFDTEDI